MKNTQTFDFIKELTQPILTTTFYQVDEQTLEHSVVHPSLIDQLIASIRIETSESQGSRSTPRSQSPVRIDALDCYIRIESEARDLLIEKYQLRASKDIKKNVSRFLDLPISKDVHQMIFNWHASAAVITDWQTRPFSPNVSCPVCAKVGTLRIKLATQSALCTSCRAIWTSATIGLLADHIRDVKRNTPVAVVENTDDV